MAERARGDLRKMHSELQDVVDYALPIGDKLLSLQPYLGHTLEISFNGVIHCVNCGRTIKKSFNQGYCFPCSQRLAACDICIVRPEKCHYDAGTCREPTWGEENCMQPHIVYLANASGIKVGITRQSQVPTRWIDQGAQQALPIYNVASRYIAGLLEVVFKDFVSDKTDWRRMLKGIPEPVDLVTRRNELWQKTSQKETELKAAFGDDAIHRIENATVTEIAYPVLNYPAKISSLSLDKQPHVEGTLNGIKGQYLILDSGVLNVRKHSGYEIVFSLDKII